MAQAPDNANLNGLKGLHGRYIGGLLLLGFLSIFALALGQRTASSGTEFGYLINQSGKQRALAQRAAMLTFEMMTQTTPEQYALARDQLQDARDQLLANHSYLLKFEDQSRVGYQMSERARAVFHREPHEIDNKIRSYVRSLDAYLSIPFASRSLQYLDSNADEYIPLAPTPLEMADALDAAVTIFEDESVITLNRIKREGQVVFAIELLALLGLGLFLFRPLVFRFQNEHERLRQANDKLSHLVDAMKKSDEARAEVEMRFKRAFENAPIGMALLDADSRLYEANPALVQMLWPGQTLPPKARFCDMLDDEDRERFEARFQELARLETHRISENFNCVDATGDKLVALVNLSAVRSKSGKFLYSVLQTRDITESFRLTNKLEIQANYDELTNLFNRRSFETKLTQAWTTHKEGGPKSFLLFMDLDQFKIVNDTSGHEAGDQLLCAIGDILRSNVRMDDAVCRLGGDEFAILLWDCPFENATHIAESIRASIENYRFEWSNESYRVGVSIGGVPVDTKMGNVSDLRQLADAACYAAKEAGRNQVHMVTEDQDATKVHRRQVRWVQRLRDALDNNRFAIYCQTIQPLNPSSVEPERVEVLIRLRDPVDRKLVPPGAFLPAAERYGMSMEIDEWVVTQLLNSLYVFHQFNAEDRRYWINLSGSSIGDKRFAPLLKAAVEKSPMAPGTINFEVTETSIIRNIKSAGRLMAEMREMGCQFALDDFGSGLSSFGYLKKLPVEYLKIDGMFIKDILKDKTDQIFVRSIIDIAHSLNIKTVAEYVEDEATLQLVRELGADYAQGYGVAKPTVLMPSFSAAQEFPELPTLETTP